MVEPDCPMVSTCLGVCEGAKEESCWELIENDGGQGNSIGMGLLYLHPGGVCLRAAQNHHWQDKEKWASEEGVWSEVVGNKLWSHPVILAKFLTASVSSWWWGWGEECWERWLEREPGRPTFQHFGTFKLISITILSSSSLFLSDFPGEHSERK